tara:strand:- start:265 stop:597 length:333 start_codon:yes stop_codon:yes gene_type:complete
MKIYNIEKIAILTPMDGFRGRMVHTRDLTIVFWEIDKNSMLPLHKHINTQTSHVVSGKLELTISGLTKVLNAGELVVIDSDELHSGKALTPCVVIDTFSPPRKDYIQHRD